MSATGRDTWKLLEEKGGPTQLERIYRLPQHYEYVKAAYFYARHNLVTILKRLPVGEKAIVFVELGDDLAEMEKYLATQPPIIVPLSTKDIGKSTAICRSA